MSIRVSRKLLLSTLNEMAVVAPKDSTVPIVKCVFMQVEPRLLRVRATDLEVHVQRTIPISGAEEFCVVVDLRQLIAVVKGAAADEIEMEAQDSGLVVSGSGASIKLEGRGVKDFPVKPACEAETGVEVDMSRLYEAVDRVAFAQGKEEYRPHLHGVYFHCIDVGRLRIVATDDNRMAYYDLDGLRGWEVPGTGQIFGQIAVKTLLRSMKQESGMAAICISYNSISVVSERLEIFSKVINHNFPDYERVIPTYEKKDIKILQVEPAKLMEIVKMASSLSNEKDRAICFDRKVGVLSIKGQKGNIVVDVPEEAYVWEGGDLSVAFRVRYLTEVASKIKGRMKMVFLDHGSPAFIYDEADNNFMSLLMPTRF